jgi:hypothetical protein
MGVSEVRQIEIQYTAEQLVPEHCHSEVDTAKEIN